VGGVESTIYHHARLLLQAGYDVSIYGGRGAVIEDKIPFIHLPEIDSRHPRVMRTGDQLAQGEISEDFYRLHDDLYDLLSASLKDTDVLIVHNAVTLHKNLALTAALKLIAQSKQPRMVAWCHDFAWQDSLYTPDLHPGYPWDLLKTAWPGVDYVAVSDHRRQRLAELLELQDASIRVIPPGVDIAQFLGLSSLSQDYIDRVQLFENEPIILLPARITRRKNIEFAIQVAASLREDYPQVALVITGPPGPHNPKNIEYLESLLEIRTNLKLDANIHFTIFASDIPPVRESSAGMINLFDPSDDPKNVAEMIVNYLKSSRSFLLRRHVLNHYTWQSIVENKIIPLLEDTVPSADD